MSISDVANAYPELETLEAEQLLIIQEDLMSKLRANPEDLDSARKGVRVIQLLRRKSSGPPRKDKKGAPTVDQL